MIYYKVAVKSALRL